jgi:hypothetical protein
MVQGHVVFIAVTALRVPEFDSGPGAGVTFGTVGSTLRLVVVRESSGFEFLGAEEGLGCRRRDFRAVHTG